MQVLTPPIKSGEFSFTKSLFISLYEIKTFGFPPLQKRFFMKGRLVGIDDLKEGKKGEGYFFNKLGLFFAAGW
jgi:hypothetical protein